MARSRSDRGGPDRLHAVGEQQPPDRFRIVFDRVRDVVLLLVGLGIVGHEVLVRDPAPNLVAVGVGLLFTLGPAAFALLPPWLGGPPRGGGS